MQAFRSLLLLASLLFSSAFVASQRRLVKSLATTTTDRPGTTTATRRVEILQAPSGGRLQSTSLFKKISQERRRQLGINDDEDEYDLSTALSNNTDPLISKIIAGSLIVVIIALLTVGVIIPLTTDYGEGVCNPALNAGRC